MIRNLKLIKYGYQFKLNMVFTVFFMLLGIVILSFNDIYKGPSIYLVFYCGFLFMIQLSNTLMTSDMVKSSPKYRQFCLGTPRVINITGFFVTVSVLIVIRLIQKGNIDEFKKYIGNELAALGFMYFICLLYIAFVYKFFIISIILFCISFTFSNVTVSFVFITYNFTFAQGVGIALLCMAAGMVLSEIIGRLIYKIPPSKFAQSASLRKYI